MRVRQAQPSIGVTACNLRRHGETLPEWIADAKLLSVPGVGGSREDPQTVPTVFELSSRAATLAARAHSVNFRRSVSHTLPAASLSCRVHQRIRLPFNVA